jgi:hypothetical protein
MKATALLYHLSEEKEKELEKALKTLGVKTRRVLETELKQKVGYLAGLEGYSETETDASNAAVSEQPEVLLMCEFSQIQFDMLMQLFKHKKLPPVTLKAVLTPTNRDWTFQRLISDLKLEHMLAMKKKKAMSHIHQE